jgi:hypothetical protein
MCIDVFGKRKVIAKNFSNFLERSAFRFSVDIVSVTVLYSRRKESIRVEHEETNGGNNIASHKDCVVSVANSGKGFGGELVEEKGDAGTHKDTNCESILISIT